MVYIIFFIDVAYNISVIPEYFAVIGAVINLLGALSYATQTFRGKTKPNRITWLLWTVIPTVAFITEISDGKHLTIAFSTLSVALGPLAIFIASYLNKSAYWKISRFDVICGMISAVAFILFLAWKFNGTGSAAIILILSITADFMAGLPSLVKSYRYPETEHYSAYLLSAIAMILTLGAMTTWSFTNYVFPGFILINDLMFLVFIFGKIGAKKEREAIV